MFAFKYLRAQAQPKRLAEEATSPETSGPSTRTLERLNEAASIPAQWKQIANVIKHRLRTKGRHQEKCLTEICRSLTVLEYLVRHAEMRVVEDIADHFRTGLEDLNELQCKSESGFDRGRAIRTRASRLLDILDDSVRLEAERNRAKQVAEDMKKRESMPRPPIQQSSKDFILDSPHIRSPSEHGLCVSPSYYKEPHSPMYSGWTPEKCMAGVKWHSNQEPPFSQAKQLEVPGDIEEHSPAEQSFERQLTPTSILDEPTKSWERSPPQLKLPESALTPAETWKTARQLSASPEGQEANGIVTPQAPVRVTKSPPIWKVGGLSAQLKGVQCVQKASSAPDLCGV